MININPLFFIVLIIIWYLGLFPQYLSVLLVAILHESGHAITARILGVKNISFKIQPWGVCMRCENINDLKKEFKVSASGPLVNLFLMLISCIFNLPDFFTFNLFMFLINLLPVYPLDGGRMIKCILKQELTYGIAENLFRIISCLVTVLVLICGIVLLYKTEMNFSVLLIAIFLILSFDCENEGDKKKAILQKNCHYSVNENENAREILKLSRKNAIFDIYDNNNRYKGSLTYREIVEEIAQNGYGIKFKEILEKHLIYSKVCSTMYDVER